MPGGGQIQPDLGELFGSIVEVLQIADQELGSLSAHSSPILRALAYQRLDGLREKLVQAEAELSQRESGLLAEVVRLDKAGLKNRAQSRASARANRAGSDLRPEVVESGARKKNPLGRTRLGSDLYGLERIFSNL